MRATLLGLAAIGCLGLSACNGSDQNPALNSTTGPTRLDSGITSSNGGGQRALGNAPNLGVNSSTGATSGGGITNQKGNTY